MFWLYPNPKESTTSFPNPTSPRVSTSTTDTSTVQTSLPASNSASVSPTAYVFAFHILLTLFTLRHLYTTNPLSHP